MDREHKDDSFDVTQCLQQIEISNLLHICAPCSELPPNISTMVGLLGQYYLSALSVIAC